MEMPKKGFGYDLRTVDDALAAQVNFCKLADYMEIMDHINDYIDVSREIDEHEVVMFEGDGCHTDYSIAFGCEEVTVFDPEEPEVNVLLNPVDIDTKELVSSFACVDIISTKYKTDKKNFPFARQHREIADMGDFLYYNKETQLIFPNCGFECFTSNYKNNLGIITPTSQCISVNNVSHLAYSCRPYFHGSEFIVFGFAHNLSTKYFLWDDKGIRLLEGIGSVVSGVKNNGIYYIYYREQESALPERFCYVNHHSIEMTVFRESRNAILINVDGVELVIPSERRICLINNGNNEMMDKTGKIYDVDLVTKDRGMYVISHGRLILDHVTCRRPDSTVTCDMVRNSLVTIPVFLELFPVPDNPPILLPPIITNVKLVKSRVELVNCLRQRHLPYIETTVKDFSKKGLIISRIRKDGFISLDHDRRYHGADFFINNTYFYAFRTLRNFVVVERRVEHGKKCMWIKLYPCMGTTVKGNVYYTQRVTLATGNKIVDISVRKSKKRTMMPFYGDKKMSLLKLFNAYKKEKNIIINKRKDEERDIKMRDVEDKDILKSIQS